MAGRKYEHPRLLTSDDVRHELGRLYWQAKQGIIDFRLHGSMVRNLLAIGQMIREKQQEERQDEMRQKIAELRAFLLSSDPQAQLPSWVEHYEGAEVINGTTEDG